MWKHNHQQWITNSNSSGMFPRKQRLNEDWTSAINNTSLFAVNTSNGQPRNVVFADKAKITALATPGDGNNTCKSTEQETV